MREEIIPKLSQSFGKEVSKNLCRLGEEANELKQYLDERVNSYFSNHICGPFGSVFDLTQEIPLYELKYFIKLLLEKKHRGVSKDVVYYDKFFN